MRYQLGFEIPDEVDVLLDERDKKFIQTKVAEFIRQILAERLEMALERIISPLELEGFLIEGGQDAEAGTRTDV